MFEIYGSKVAFDQWDLDQLVTCSCLQEGDKVVFRGLGKAYETTAFVQGGVILADVPNFLLKEPGSIRVDLGWGLDSHLDCRTTFNVIAKDKPEGYKCTYNIKNRTYGNLELKTINGQSLVGDGNLETDDIAPDYSIIREVLLAPNEGEVVTVSNGTSTLTASSCYPVAFVDKLDHTNIAGIKPIGNFTGGTYTACLFEVEDGEAIYGHAAANVKLVDR